MLIVVSYENWKFNGVGSDSKYDSKANKLEHQIETQIIIQLTSTLIFWRLGMSILYLVTLARLISLTKLSIPPPDVICFRFMYTLHILFVKTAYSNPVFL